MNLGAVSSVLDFKASGFEDDLSTCEQPRVSGARSWWRRHPDQSTASGSSQLNMMKSGNGGLSRKNKSGSRCRTGGDEWHNRRDG